MKKYFLIFACIFAMVCGCSHAEKESLSDAQCGIPFGKETIREIRFIYWVKVREPGTYDGIVDSGIRKRIFIMTDQTYIKEHLKFFNITKITPDSDNTPVSGEIIFVNKDGQEWQADFFNEKILRLSSGQLLHLKNRKFYWRRFWTVRGAEREFRDPDFKLPPSVFNNGVALTREEARRLSGLDYNRIFDGASEDFIIKLRTANLEEAYRIAIGNRTYKPKLIEVVDGD